MEITDSVATKYYDAGAFNKSSPTNGASDQSLNPTLTWGAASGVTSYEYCYDTSNDSACSSWTSNATSTTVGLSGLSTGTTYYWHVRALNAFGTTYANGSETAFCWFTTGTPQESFEKRSPGDGAAGQPASPILSWGSSGGAASYEYCYDTMADDTYSSWISTGSLTSVDLSGLAALTTYYWQVRAVNSIGMT